mgnify:CR=1 FL=1
MQITSTPRRAYTESNVLRHPPLDNQKMQQSDSPSLDNSKYAEKRKGIEWICGPRCCDRIVEWIFFMCSTCLNSCTEKLQLQRRNNTEKSMRTPEMLIHISKYYESVLLTSCCDNTPASVLDQKPCKHTTICVGCAIATFDLESLDMCDGIVGPKVNNTETK